MVATTLQTFGFPLIVKQHVERWENQDGIFGATTFYDDTSCHPKRLCANFLTWSTLQLAMPILRVLPSLLLRNTSLTFALILHS
jgi:hypothetical protein